MDSFYCGGKAFLCCRDEKGLSKVSKYLPAGSTTNAAEVSAGMDICQKLVCCLIFARLWTRNSDGLVKETIEASLKSVQAMASLWDGLQRFFSRGADL